MSLAEILLVLVFSTTSVTVVLMLERVILNSSNA